MDTRGTKFYVGSRLDDYKKAQAIRDILVKTYGWQQTYDWTDFLSREKDANPTVYALAAAAEINGVKDADVCVFLLPGGRGCWAELGGSLCGTGLVYVVGEPFHEGKEPPVFYYHPAVNRVRVVDPAKVCDIVVAGRESYLSANPQKA